MSFRISECDAACCHWVDETWESFLAQEANMPTLIFAHGNTLQHDPAMDQCWDVYKRMRCCPGQKRLVFWSWPAQRPVAVHVAADVRGGELGGQRYSVRGPGTLSPDPSAQGRYQEYLAMVENWSRIGVVIQGSRITGGKYSPEHFLEVQSLLDEPPVPPWPQNSLLDD